MILCSHRPDHHHHNIEPQYSLIFPQLLFQMPHLVAQKPQQVNWLQPLRKFMYLPHVRYLLFIAALSLAKIFVSVQDF